MATLFDNFYQMGFIARDLDAATAMMGRTHGVTRWRRKRSSPTMQAAHAWAGNVMLELIQLDPGAPAIYDGYVPEDPAAVRLHHHGFRIPDENAWAQVNRAVQEAGLATPMQGSVMDGQLNYLYADTLALTGIYSEYVFLKGAALSLYDDVPHN